MSSQYIKIKNHINGEWLDESNGQYEPLKNPSTGAVIGEVPLSSAETSRQAVAAAAEAFPEWSAMPLPKRMDFIFKMHRAMVDNHEMLAESHRCGSGQTHCGSPW